MTNQIKDLASLVCETLEQNDIKYLVYGSFAYYLYTKEELIINDIDIIVEQESFAEIERVLKGQPFKLYISEHSIHANHTSLIGNDNKPFDVSFDSYQKYFAKQGIEMNRFTKVVIGNVSAPCMTISDLIKLYEYSLTQNNQEKFAEYHRKIEELKNL